MLAVAWLFFERVKHLLGSTTVTGGTMGGAALCKQALIAKPLSGLCVGFCVVFFITATHYVTRCSLAIFFMPHVCMKPSFPVKALFVPVLFFFLFHEIYSSCTVFFLLQFLSGLFRHPPTPSRRAFFAFLSVPRSLSYSSPSLLRRPPSLSQEIDWVIWLGASSARFLARGKERSRGDMTTCRNNNNIHNIGMDGGMRTESERERRGLESALARRYHPLTDSAGCFHFKYSLHTMVCHSIVSPFLSVSRLLYLSATATASSVHARVVF